MNPVRIVKVGGSLFNWKQTPAALRGWLEQQQPVHNVLVAGGGDFADLVRAADRRFSLGERRSHWICIELLRATSRLLAALLPEATHVCQWSDLTRRLDSPESSRWLVLDPVQFLREIEATMPGQSLAQSWDVTSDAISARIADVLGAAELVLLKSSSPGVGPNLSSLGESGFVDRAFSRVSANLPRVRIVNLRQQCRSGSGEGRGRSEA